MLSLFYADCYNSPIEVINVNAIEINNLHRDYIVKKGFIKPKKETINAVRGISFSVEPGEIFGLLGQNGAGKSTIIKILTTMLAPTSGSCKVLGYDINNQEKLIRPKINFIFGGELGVYRRLSARDNMRYFSNLYKIPMDVREDRIAMLLGLVSLSEKADLRVETFSKGMIQRLQIARGLINDPQILFMDEPTIGLDPLGAETLRNIIKDLRAKGKTVLLTTHNMFEADELCDRIAIINKGVIVANDTPERIKQQMESDSTIQQRIQEFKQKEESRISHLTLEEAYIQLIRNSEVV